MKLLSSIAVLISTHAFAGGSGRIHIEGTVESYNQDQVVLFDQNHHHYRIDRKYFSQLKPIWPGDHVNLLVKPDILYPQAKP